MKDIEKISHLLRAHPKISFLIITIFAFFVIHSINVNTKSKQLLVNMKKLVDDTMPAKITIVSRRESHSNWFGTAAGAAVIYNIESGSKVSTKRIIDHYCQYFLSLEGWYEVVDGLQYYVNCKDVSLPKRRYLNVTFCEGRDNTFVVYLRPEKNPIEVEVEALHRSSSHSWCW